MRILKRICVLLLVGVAPLLAEDNLKFGQPACTGPVLDKQYFVVCYDSARKVPTWVGYALTKEDSLAKATWPPPTTLRGVWRR
jgi:DNA/RNA endonuclease G (NUC1)